VHGAARRWPAAQRVGLAALDAWSQVALLPFRRRRVHGRAHESAALVARTEEYNAAAERYFARFTSREFLLDKPFSDTALAAKHLTDAGILIDAMRLRPGDVVVELGAGSCWLSHMLNRFGCATIAVDVSPTALALGRELFQRDPRTRWSLEPKFVPYDGRRLPLDDRSCDRIVINDAFHHVPNQRELLAEMFRVLRADGAVAMSEPGRGHGSAAHSVAEAESGVLENELVLEDLAALAEDVGFSAATVIVASPLVRHEIPARELGAFMGGRRFASYWKALCSGLEQHHYVVLHKGGVQPTTARPSRLSAQINIGGSLDRAVRAAEPLGLEVRLTNLGDTRWLSRPGESGWTRLGAHLYRNSAPRALVDFDWFRQGLPSDIAPGHTVMMTAQLPAIPAAGDYVIEFDLVVEGLTWMADRGSAPVTLSLHVH
jgi:SAM-dependent methyltransferase